MRKMSVGKIIRERSQPAFTLIELMVVIATIAVLAALLLPALSRAKASSRRSACLGNVGQINLAIQMYADDHNNEVGYFAPDIYYSYADCILPYLGRRQNTSPQNPLLACPADNSLHKLALTHYSSYGFNGVVRGSNDFGMAQRRFSTVRDPSKTALDGEISGGMGISWHAPRKEGQYSGAPNVGGFVDGHANYVKIYWNAASGIAGFPFYYEPPAGYNYKWSAN
jgi:prepilin-type N-terminal cleavage/methylation domain-containing protein